MTAGCLVPLSGASRMMDLIPYMDKDASDRQGTDDTEIVCGVFLIDAHAHIYHCFDENIFLDGALKNFRAAGASLECPTEPIGWLLLTESSGCHFFRQFRTKATLRSESRWTFLKTAEDCSLITCRSGVQGTRFVVVAGRQIVTSERLEVLALGTSSEFPDGLGLRATLDSVIESGAIAVLPWGFGKWWFRRGKLVGEVLRAFDPEHLYVGDNGGRPAFLPLSKLIDLAATRNIYNLPGSDPLPFGTQNRTAGGHGFVLRGEVDLRRPAEGLKSLLRRQQSQPQTYGGTETMGRFLRNQFRIQARRLYGRPRS